MMTDMKRRCLSGFLRSPLVAGGAAFVGLGAVGFLGHAFLASSAPARRAVQPAVRTPEVCSERSVQLTQLPITFIQNAGQWGTAALFVARRGAIVLRAEPDALALDLRGPGKRALVRFCFDGAAEGAEIEGEDLRPGVYNFFLGSDPARWRSDVRGYASVRYRGVYNGIDVRVREGAQGRLEYDLLLEPRADLEAVAIRCEGIEGMRVADDASLVLETGAGRLCQPRPVVWQIGEDGERREVTCRYRLLGRNRFGFSIAQREPTLALVVDPGLEWSTFLGGTGADIVRAIGLDSSGAATVAGETDSLDFPTTPGAFDTTYNGNTDAFVTQLSPSGNSVIHATFLGGTGPERLSSVALDASAAAVVSGATYSRDFPTTAGAFDTTHNGLNDVFVARLSPSGGSLVYSTFLGGIGSDSSGGIALDTAGRATVAGITYSPGFPTTPGAFDRTYNGAGDAFVAQLSSSGASLVYATFLGGSGLETADALALDTSGGAVVAGGTGSEAFPATAGAFSTALTGRTDVFVARLTPSGAALVYATYLGGNDQDACWAVAVDRNGAATVGGWTVSADFPTTLGAFDTSANGDMDCFVARLSPSGTSLDYSTYLGGAYPELVLGLAVDGSSAATVVGGTSSPDFPTTAGAFQEVFNNVTIPLPMDGFVVRLSPSGSSLVYATFLGGARDDGVADVALEGGAAVVAGSTDSTDFPTTAGAFATTYNAGSSDGFIARLDMLPTGVSAFGVSSPGCFGPLAIGVTSMPFIGNSAFSITCTNAPPNVPWPGGMCCSPRPDSPRRSTERASSCGLIRAARGWSSLRP